MKAYNIAVVGATGMVGRAMLQALEERLFPVNELKLLASSRTAGQTLNWNGHVHVVEELRPEAFHGMDVALMSAGGEVSRVFAPEAVKRGCVVIDNSSAWRMDAEVPLVVPEVNPGDISLHKGIISNPNCSTIQSVVPLAPLHRAFGLKRVIYTTYQAVSGAGKGGCDDLENGLRNLPPRTFPYPIADNIIPQIDAFAEDGYTKEEWKMINETRKILREPGLAVTATCVRVPVSVGHSVSINAEFHKPFNMEDVFAILDGAPGVVLCDNPSQSQYPMPITARGTGLVYVGRIRRDASADNALCLWAAADNVRKGAADNAVQIAELLLNTGGTI